MDLLLELKNYLDTIGRLKIYPSKKKYKIFALMFLSGKFQKDVIYTERDVNEILDNYHTFNDKCLLRRELFNNKFLGRSKDCSKYWLEEKQPALDDFNFN
jgi:hypothetical protein